jgi:hypothetical protein
MRPSAKSFGACMMSRYGTLVTYKFMFFRNPANQNRNCRQRPRR